MVPSWESISEKRKKDTLAKAI